MTVSGAHKGELESRDFLIVDLTTSYLQQEENHRPSAEALLHLQLYKKYREVGRFFIPILSRRRPFLDL